MPQPKYQLRRCSGYRRPMASGAAASRSDSEPASGASRELVRVWEGQAGSANRFLPSRAHFQWRRFSACRRCLASGIASSRGAAQSATHTSTTSRRDNRSRAPPRYSRHCLKPCQIIVDDWPCHNPCVLRKTMTGVASAHITMSCTQMVSLIRSWSTRAWPGQSPYASRPATSCSRPGFLCACSTRWAAPLGSPSWASALAWTKNRSSTPWALEPVSLIGIPASLTWCQKPY